jgi:hypothetical protein
VRQKLEQDPARPRRLCTEPVIGYRLESGPLADEPVEETGGEPEA